MEDLTLALITLTSFVLLFVVAIFADRAGMEADQSSTTTTGATGANEAVLVPVDEPATTPATTKRHPHVDAADVA